MIDCIVIFWFDCYADSTPSSDTDCTKLSSKWVNSLNDFILIRVAESESVYTFGLSFFSEKFCRKGSRDTLWLIVKENLATVNFHAVNRRKTCVLSIGFTTLCQINFLLLFLPLVSLVFIRLLASVLNKSHTPP